MHIIFVSALDGDQLVDFYWIDPVMVAERLAGLSVLKSDFNAAHIGDCKQLYGLCEG